MNQKISATIGILTFNSAINLTRALESVKNFQEIIIADGGSTDATISIAERYGAKIVFQSNPGNPIENFARERQRILDVATKKWFFYLDADEIMSQELQDEIHRITTLNDPTCGGYRVRYLKTNEAGTQPYRTFKEYYQVRLFRTDIGAQFIRPVHERIRIPEEFVIRQTEAPWYVPLSRRDLHLSLFLPKAWRRTRLDASAWIPRGVGSILKRIFHPIFLDVPAVFFKAVAVKFRFGSAAIPFRYSLMKVVYDLCLSINFFLRMVRLLFERIRAVAKTSFFALTWVIWKIGSVLGDSSGPVVLMYHAVSKEGGPLAVSPDAFRTQMKYLRENRKVFSMGDLLLFLDEKRSLPRNTVVVSIDDGYLDTYTKAFPVLKEFQIPFTLFLTTDLRPLPELRNLARPTWDQLREMYASGLMTIGLHGHEHLRVETIAESPDALKRELSDSSHQIERELGVRPEVYAFAFGLRHKKIPEYLESLGIRACFGISDGTVVSSQTRSTLRRVQIDRSTTNQLFRYRTTGGVDMAFRIKRWFRS